MTPRITAHPSSALDAGRQGSARDDAAGSQADPSGAPTVSRLRRLLGIGAVLACLPYLAIKTTWLLGGRVGLLDPTFGASVTMQVANALTFAMEAVALALAVAFVAPWGRRLPAPVVLLPMWIGTGLLGGILAAIPFTIATQVLVTPAAAGGSATARVPIAGWVFVVVYVGFAVLGLCLIAGFALYAVDRWLRPGGWLAPLGAWPVGSGPRRPAAIRSLDDAVPGEVAASCGRGRLVGDSPRGGRLAVTPWAVVGGVAVLGGLAIAATGVRGDPRGLGWALADGTLALGAGLGLFALATRRPVRLSGVIPTLAVWLGSGALAAWGMYHGVLLLVPNDLAGSAPIEISRILVPGLKIALGCTLVAGLWGTRPRLRPLVTAARGSVR